MGHPKKYKRLKLLISVLVLSALPLIAFSNQHVAASQYPGTSGKIVFASQRDGNDEIYIMNPDGSMQQNLTNSPSTNDSAPAVSPDGTKIVYSSSPVSDPLSESIWVMDADGTNQQQLTTPAQSNSDADWSPDGTKIAWARGQINQESIYTMNADGTNQTPIIAGGGVNDAYGAVSWSPDGTKIAYVHLDPGIHYNIFVSDADGSNPVQLTNNNPSQYATFPSWSPDGNRIAFIRAVSATIISIYTVDATDGSNQTQLTTTGLSLRPVWSPDSTKMSYFYEASSGEPQSIWTMNADGTGQTQITFPADSVGDFDPFWSVIPATISPSSPPAGGSPGAPGPPSTGFGVHQNNALHALLLYSGIAAGLFVTALAIKRYARR